MKKHISCLLLGLVALGWATDALAQRRIDLRHNGASSLFTEFQPALDAAVNGDTIYLPGTTFVGGFNITKKLAIIGVGVHPDSTFATNKTQFFNSLSFDAGSSGSSITGVKCGQIQFYNSGNHTVSRIVSNGVYNYYGSNCIFSECIFGTIYNQVNSQILDCIIGNMQWSTNCVMKNNIVLDFIGNSANCLVSNNLIRFNADYYSPPTNNCSYLNNIWKEGFSLNGSFGNGNTGSGNIQVTDFNAQFVNFVAANFTVDNFYQWDFHLTNPAYNTGGTDGTAIGIYGGMFPWKAGSVPFTPHINLKIIAPATNSAGQLPVTIRAKAQGN